MCAYYVANVATFEIVLLMQCRKREIKEKLEGHEADWDCSYGIERFVPYGTIRKRSGIMIRAITVKLMNSGSLHE